jgi:hypothetical protein
MLLTISTTYQPATDLGYLLHKNPDKLQTFDLAFGQAQVFYPVATPELCTAALVLDINSVELARGKKGRQPKTLGDYVTDRPYVASSFLSVALAQVYRASGNGNPLSSKDSGLAQQRSRKLFARFVCAFGLRN